MVLYRLQCLELIPEIFKSDVLHTSVSCVKVAEKTWLKDVVENGSALG